jgi:hypothetical protein
VYDICQSVDCLLQHPEAKASTYVPAYQTFCSAVELLGRCIRGNIDLWGNVADLHTGFKWLAESEQVGLHDDTVVIKTGRQKYTVDLLTALGHYAGLDQAKGGRGFKGMRHAGRIDPDILDKMLPLLVGGLERYWEELQESDLMCNRLARARVIGLHDWPVLENWLLRTGHDGASVPTLSDTFGKLDWSLESRR